MVEKLGIDKNIIDDLSNLLYKNYGTTMAGLRVCMIPLFSLLYIL
jgi:putative hydrolase of the HAD superfamily